MNLDTSVSSIKGVGPKISASMAAAGIITAEDLIYFFPRKYEDFSEITKIKDIRPGNVTLRVRVEAISSKRVRRGMGIAQATMVDDTGKVPAVWFNQSYRVAQLKSASEFYVSGEFSLQRQQYQLVNPSVEKVSEVPVQTGRVLPVYKEVKGLKSHMLRKVIDMLKPAITMLPETLPSEVIKSEQLISHADAVLKLHFPKSQDDIVAARHRLGFEELFELTLASTLNREENAKLKSWHIPFNKAQARQFSEQLPFALTNAQRRAVWDIVQDFESGTPMNRLLQGDVGSGKTVVAGMSAYLAAQHGFQSVVMAPTEILARQHANTISQLLGPFGVNVGLLVGSVKKSAKTVLKQALKSGDLQIVVGTHALLQDDVEFFKLGFVVVDEQHRFGVAQRQSLLHKSKHMPHMLAMSATPIPRSLALTAYGELDISVLDELPAGRLPIETSIQSPNSRSQLYAKVEVELANGRQMYVVCPLISSDPEAEVKSVQDEHKRLRQSVFKHRRVGLLHGQLPAAEKDAVMQAFKDGEYDVLVSTTVVEVGVDVPNATIMIIEGAERFGLAQLHQLRGRVGRSSHQSYCFLVPSTSARPSRRLRELERSNDGFYLAEVDLKLRGPGEIYGRAQHGQLDLRIATLGDSKMIARAQSVARWCIKNKIDLLQYKRLMRRVKHYQRVTTLN